MFYGACYVLVTDVSDNSDGKINILSYKLTSVSNNFLQFSPTRHVLPGELRRVHSQASVVATYFPTLEPAVIRLRGEQSPVTAIILIPPLSDHRVLSDS